VGVYSHRPLPVVESSLLQALRLAKQQQLHLNLVKRGESLMFNLNYHLLFYDKC